MPVVRWESLFFGRQIRKGYRIVIGPKNARNQLNLCVREPTEKEIDQFIGRTGESREDGPWMLTRENEEEPGLNFPLEPVPSRSFRASRLSRLKDNEISAAINFCSVGPGLLTNYGLQALWSSLALTDAETYAVEALNLIAEPQSQIERIATVGGRRYLPSRVIVRRSGDEGPVPLKSLGDGAVRLLGITASLVNSRNGLLFIDEVENGIHHSIQDRFWELILKTAKVHNVQVLATTHGWDALAAFARALERSGDVNGALVRLERDTDNGLYAVEYSERDLQIAAEQGIEVR